jgi:Ca2+-binding RTX toxin-like protein
VGAICDDDLGDDSERRFDWNDGGAGDDNICGDGGNDTILGGTGNDRLSGGDGDDVFIWRTGDGNDTFNGGRGNDRLELDLSTSDITAALRADLAAYQQWAAAQSAAAGSLTNLASQTTGSTFTFGSLGLTISVLEGMGVKVDGQTVAIDDLINAAPVAAAEVQFVTDEDVAVQASIEASDADGDSLTYVVQTGPSRGGLVLDSATGAFVYTPTSDWNGTDTFIVRITDPSGASVTQTVRIGVDAVADAPALTTTDATIVLAKPVVGTESGDVIVGNVTPATAVVPLNLAAALRDADGSEIIAISIAGLPEAATLSAGVRQPDGSWLLTAANLDGLNLSAPTGSDLTLTVTATAMEANGSSASTSSNLLVTFDRAGLGDDLIDGAGGNDVIDGRSGNDRLSGGVGDDVFIQRAGDGQDTISGGDGYDMVRLGLASTDVTPAFLSDIANYSAWANAGASGQFTFATLDLTVDTIEEISITVDGRSVSIAELLNVAPTASASATLTTTEDTPVQGTVSATDANGDQLTYAIVDGPGKGAVSLDAASGRFVYTPSSNVSGNDSFSVRVTDKFGESVVQTLNIGITARADTSTLQVGNSTVQVARISTLSGTSIAETIRGDQYAATATFALAIGAALTDTDGSESLRIRVAGVPAGATLSAGALQSDGSWLLQSSDLTGLSMTAPTARNLSLQVAAIAEDGSSTAQTTGTLQVAFQRGGSMNDTIMASMGNDTYDGARGADTVNYSAMASGVTVDLGTGTVSGPASQKLIAIENIVGSSGDDVITGNGSANVINAGDGDDVINGGAGNDQMTGVAGDDILIGGAGNDRVNGGNGNDLLIGGSGNDAYDGGVGYDVLDYSEATNAVVVNNGRVTGMGSDRYSNVEKVVGSSFADTFSGSRNVDTFDGGAGNDWFRGFEGSDIFSGGAGADTFVWNERDVVSGKKSQGVDVISDFGQGDRLDLTSFTGTFATDPSQVKVTDTVGGSVVSIKVAGAYYDVVLLQNVHGITASSLAADGQLIA